MNNDNTNENDLTTTVVVTSLEMELLEAVINSDHASDQHGLAGYIYENELDMTIFRGVISSLIQKGVIWPTQTEEHGMGFGSESNRNTWVAIRDEFQQECDYEVDSNCYRLINIELREAN